MASTDLEKLVVQLSADIKKYENALNRAQGITNQKLGAIQKKALSSSTAMSSAFARAGLAIAAAFATKDTLMAAQRFVDAASRIQNALKVAGLEGEKLRDVYDTLFASAQKNAAPIESLVTLYGRLSLVQKELGVSQEQLLSFTDNVAMALRAGGTSATEASGALLQLSQALGGGVVRADEFNSIIEGTPTIARAAALGLKEAGGSVSALRNLVVDGKVSSEAFFAAFQAGAVVLDQQVATSTLTLAQRFQQLENELINTAGKLDQASGASNALGNAIGALTAEIGNFGNALVGIADSDLGYFIGKIVDATGQVRGLIETLGGLSGFFGTLGTLQTDILTGQQPGSTKADAIRQQNEKRIQQRIDDAFSAPDPTTGRLPSRIQPLPGASGSAVKPVSINDYAPPPGSKSGGGGAKKGRSGGQSAFASETDQIKERTAALQAETAALASVNPLVDDYGFALEKARAEQDLLAAAQKSGVAITPELKASISALAGGYAQASAEAEKLAQSQDRARQAADDFKSTGKDIVGGFISDLRQGKSAADALASALDKIVDKLVDVSLNAAFGIGGGGGGLLSLFGFADGGIAAHGRPRPLPRFAKGGVARSASIFGEAGPEAAVPLPDGRSIPVKFKEPSIPKASSSGGQSSYAPVYNIDARGADAAAVARLERSLQERDRTEAKRVAGYSRTQQSRKTRA